MPQASSYILGDEARAKTRAQTRKLSESEEKKPAVKRTTTMAQTAKVSSVVAVWQYGWPLCSYLLGILAQYQNNIIAGK